MARLWKRDPLDGWSPLPLTREELGPLAAVLAGPLLEFACAEAKPPGVEEIVRHWVLMTEPDSGVRVNGAAVATGIRVLRDRDEIVLPPLADLPWRRLYFSTETLARVEPYPDATGAALCARCQTEMVHGEPAVRCPTCGFWHHESEEYPCWTYAPTCARCRQPTDLEAGYRWTPEEL